MSEQRTTGNGNGAQVQEVPALPDDLLSRIVAESERHFAARASRPSPVHLKSWEEIERFAEKAAHSGMVPKDYVGRPDAIVIAVQMGSELGLAPMQSLQNIAVVNGRPSVWGDAMPGLCRASGVCRSIREWQTGEGESLTYWCEAIRRDDPNPVVKSFSVANAKKAGLWGKDIWQKYPERMLQQRARGFALRDAFPDVLKGLISAEEAADIPFEDTGLTVTMPPVATQQPITQPAEKPKRTWATLLDEIEADAAAALTEEDLDTLAKDERVVNAKAQGSEPVKARLEGFLFFHRERVRAFNSTPPEDDGSSAAEPDSMETDPLADVLPEGWTAPASDALGQEAAQLIAAYRAAPTLAALEALRTSQNTRITMSALMQAGRSNDLRQIEAAYVERKGALAG